MQKGNGKVEDRIKDRYNGTNDPLAQKILEKQTVRKIPKAPEDETISTLFVGGIDDKTQKEQISVHFEKFGKI